MSRKLVVRFFLFLSFFLFFFLTRRALTPLAFAANQIFLHRLLSQLCEETDDRSETR